MAKPESDEDFERAIAPLLGAAGPVMVTGSAGCGKTTVALRKAALAINNGLGNRHARVLFLSFANATVDRVAEHASDQLTRDVRPRLEVATYHSFAWSILRSHGYLLGAPRGVRIMTQAEQNAFLSVQDADADVRAELRRQFETLGHIAFDEFAGLANEILSGSPSLLKAYATAYPLIVLDEFQDTTDDQWALVKTLSAHSQLISLGDPDQRIYDFVPGSSETRFEDFMDSFAPVQVDLSAWNWRSPGSSITRFGRDVLRGSFEYPYDEVDVVASNFPTLLRLKTTLLAALKRRQAAGGGTIAILTPTNALAVRAYDYIREAQENPTLPAIEIDIHTTKEEGYAALIFIGALMEIDSDDEHRDAIACEALAHYLRTKSTKLSTTSRDTANRLEGYATKLRGGASVSIKIVQAVRKVVDGGLNSARTGHVYADYLTTVSLLASSDAGELKPMAGYVRMLNLVNRGSGIDTALADAWRASGTYAGAGESMRNAVAQFQLTSSKRGNRDLIVMTIHRAKGREFDEVIIYEERYEPLLRLEPSQRDLDAARYALNVAVTRAKKRVTIITPGNAPSPLLTLRLDHVTPN